MNTIRQHLGWKLFLSYMLVIVVGVVSLAVFAEFISPTVFNRHMTDMEAIMGVGTAGMMGDLTQSFQRVVNETLIVAAALATVTAAIVSTIVTRRIVGPVNRMQMASRRIADGHYEERVEITGEDELADLGQSFNQMAYALDQVEVRRRQLIGDVAHELRTPLSNLKSVMEALQDGVLPAEPQTFLNVERELNRLQRLVLDLEELSRAEAGQIPLQLESVNPVTFVNATVDRLRLQYDDKGVKLRPEAATVIPDVLADQARMTQVMLNLLGNALQYTPAGGEVVVSVSADKQSVFISVQDTGIGLSADTLPHIFERFYRVDTSRSRVGGGSGIGLTISQHLVEAHGGTLAADSAGLGQGSTFVVTLPKAQ
jgi:histidine kinase